MSRLFPIIMRTADRLAAVHAEVREAAWVVITIARFRR